MAEGAGLLETAKATNQEWRDQGSGVGTPGNWCASGLLVVHPDDAGHTIVGDIFEIARSTLTAQNPHELPKTAISEKSPTIQTHKHSNALIQRLMV